EVDFIKIENKHSLKPDLVGYEIKYKDKIKPQDTKGLIHFDKKYHLQEKIIISKSVNETIGEVKVIDFTMIG
ncbi:hypothetical protein KGV52_01675, partial [Candidatus Gracilibacteria bacterium]|nr:hypothetical protein [Candidatus Gracilibacteria bacterium]